MSDTERWRDADAVLDRLLDLPEPERDAALAALELAPELRVTVQRLLAAHARASGPLERDPPAALAPEQSPGVLGGRRLGRWRLEQEIGQGGMSVVYRARSEVEPVGQLAAIKLLTLGALAGGGAERFRLEQALLARLNHPHLATLFDAGVADDGTPWLAMALVEGQRIDHWCQRHGLAARAIVPLFLDVCDAVAHAHRALVIHRDLKPSNVLVDANGHVRVLDFGIARLVDDDQERTGTAWRALSPMYAAPEQFAGAPASTAMDVYGLGALLYALLAGRAPRAAGAGAQASLVPPSVAAAETGAEAGRRPAARALSGDLDAIVMHALESEPERRYPTVAALADDLRRWLAGQPVHAVAADRGYVLRKFIARHRRAVATAVAILAALALGLGVALWQAQAARREAARATAEAQRAQATQAFLVDLFEAANPETRSGEAPTVPELIESGRARLGEAFPDEPRLRAEVALMLGQLYLATGNHERARDLIEGAAQTAETLPAVPSLQRSVLWHRGRLEQFSGNNEAAIPLFRAGLAAIDARDPDARTQAFDLTEGLVYSLDQTGQRQEAHTLAERALVLGGDWSDPARAIRARLLLAGQSEPARAEQLLREAMDHPAFERGPRGNRLVVARSLATALHSQSRNEEALVVRERAMQLARRMYQPPHRQLAFALSDLAASQMQTGRVDLALANMADVVSMYDTLGMGGSAEAASAANNLGSALMIAGRGAEAELMLQRAADAARRLLGENDWRHASALGSLALAQELQDKLVEAEANAAKALAMVQQGAPATVLPALAEVGSRVALANGDARVALERAELAAASIPPDNPAFDGVRLRAAVDRARALALLDRQVEADGAFAQVRTLLAANRTSVARDLAYIEEVLGDRAAAQGDGDAARRHWQQALRQREAANQPQHRATLGLRAKLAAPAR